MMIKAVLFVLVFYSVGLCENYAHFPTNFDGDSLALAAKDTAHFKGALVAMEGFVDTIATVATPGGDKPYLHLRLIENNPDTLMIWIAPLITLDSSQVKQNDQIRVLGYFDLFDAEKAPDEAKTNKDGFRVLGMAILNISQKAAHVAPEADVQFKVWKEGILDQPEQ